MSLLDVCRRAARRTFGIERFGPEQELAMAAILELVGRNAKNVRCCEGFQTPAVTKHSPTEAAGV
jgi:dephospho-CoA kinase